MRKVKRQRLLSQDFYIKTFVSEELRKQRLLSQRLEKGIEAFMTEVKGQRLGSKAFVWEA